jgi:hypothetical protein
LTTKRNKYIFDMGESSTKNRISLFLDKMNNLCFRVVDKKSNSSSVVIKSDEILSDSARWFLVDASVQTHNDTAYLCMRFNGTEIAFIKIQNTINVSDSTLINNLHLGSNINGQYCACFDLMSFGILKLNGKEKSRLIHRWGSDEELILAQLSSGTRLSGFMRFKGNQFLNVK